MSVRWPLMLVACLLAPGSAGAQPPGAIPRIGLLDNGSLAARAPLWDAFRQGMRELGYVEGRTVRLEARSADGKYERLPALAAELVRLKVDVIVATGTASHAAKQATATIPIVTASGDPLATGLVASLARPGGNVTGLTTLTATLNSKLLDLARDLVPGASRFAILWSRQSANSVTGVHEAEAAAPAVGVSLQSVGVQSLVELDEAFATIVQARPAVLLVGFATQFAGQGRRLAELALKHRLPSVSGSRTSRLAA